MFLHNGMSILLGSRFEDELDSMNDVNNVVTYQEVKKPDAQYYENGVNYIFYGDDEGFDPEEPAYSLLKTCWNISKLSNTSHIVHNGSDLNYGERVFGFPLVVGDIPKSGESNYGPTKEILQFGHVLNSLVKKNSYNSSTEKIILEVLDAERLSSLQIDYNDFIGEKFVIGYYDNLKEDKYIEGYIQTKIYINENFKELKCTVTSIYDQDQKTYIEAHIDSNHNEYILNNIKYIAPDNQYIRIAPLGKGKAMIPPANHDNNKLLVLEDNFLKKSNDFNLPGWSYILDETVLSKKFTSMTPILEFDLDEQDFYKMIIILVRNQSLSKFPNGIRMDIFK